MARLLYGLAALLALIAGAALVVPGLLDWSAQKPAIAAALQRVTGQQVVIAGDVSVTLLPTPALELQDVRMPARAGSPQPDLARLKSLRLELALLPLLGGSIEARAMTLEEPELAIAIARDGTGNWHAPQAAPERPQDGAAMAAGDWAGLGLNDVTIRDGRFSYRDERAGAAVALTNIDAEVSTEAARGPMRGRGTAESGRSPVGFQFRLGEAQNRLSHLNALIDLPGLDMKAELTGEVATGAQAGFDGHVRLEGSRAEVLSILVDRPAPRSLLAEAFGGRFTLEGDVAAEKDALSAIHLRLETDSNYATGSLAYRLGHDDGGNALTAALTMQKIDLDRWLRAEPPEGGGGKAADAGASHALDAPFVLPRRLEANLDLAVEAIVLNRSVVRDMHANLRLVDGELTVNQLTAGFPGGTRVTAFGFVGAAGGAPRFDGTVEAASDNLRGLLDWLSVDVSQVPAEMLRRWRARAKATATPGLVRLDELRTTVDVTPLKGAATLHMDDRPHLSLAVEGERFDLDSYLPDAAGAGAGAGAQAPQAAAPPPVPSADTWRLGGFDATVEAKLGGVIWRGERVAGVELAAAFDDGRVTLQRLHASDAGGSEVQVTAEAGPTKLPGGMEATVQVSAARPEGVLRLFDIMLPADPRARGPLSLEARLARGKDEGVWAVEGRFALGDVASTIGGTARLRTAEKGRPLFVELGADRVDLDFLLALLAAQSGAPNGRATATPLGVAEAPSGTAGWSDAAFPPGLLQLPDVELALKAGALLYLGQRLENAELSVQARRGSLEIKRLTGGLHGGTLTLEGRLSEAETPGALSLASVATLDGANAGALLALREVAQLSDAAVGLKLSVEGTGETPAALVANLAGKGRVWGQGGRLDGFDLARANEALAAGGESVGLVNALAESTVGSTKISSFGGDFRIEAGALRTRSLRVQADGGNGEISGAFDLLRREIDAELRLRFAAFPDAPPILARVQGPPGDARVVVEFNALQAWLKNRAPRAKPASN